MRLGRLGARVQLEARVRLPDEAGGAIESFAGIATRWAAVTDEAGGPALDAGRLVARRSIRVVIRARSDLDAIARIVIAGAPCAVLARLRDQPRRGFATLICEEARAP